MASPEAERAAEMVYKLLKTLVEPEIREIRSELRRAPCPDVGAIGARLDAIQACFEQ